VLQNLGAQQDPQGTSKKSQDLIIMNNLKSFLQTKEDQINANLSNGEPTDEQLTSFVRAMSDQMYQIVSQAPTTVKNICLV
jgi:hypothetical protein